MFSLSLSALLAAPVCTLARAEKFAAQQYAVAWGVPQAQRSNALSYYRALREDGKTHAQATKVIRAAVAGGKDCPPF